MSSESIASHPDRLLPADPATRSIARSLLADVEHLPIVSPHGHVPPAMIAEDTPFPDPADLFISPDHCLTRLLHANGEDLADLRVGGRTETDPRESWRIFCRHWKDFDGTATGYWLGSSFVNVFGIEDSKIDEAGDGLSGYAGYLRAMQNRRRYFIDHGAVSPDHGTHDALTLKLAEAEADRLLAKGLAGEFTAEEAHAFEANMTYQFARMAVEDGLVMTLHPSVHRNHSPETFEKFGADTGHDIPFRMEYTRSLQPLLADFGNAKGFNLVLFTIDETVFSREIAPLAGFYPSVYVGAPWWFIDEPDAMHYWRSAITGTAGFTRSSGFIDDARAFTSIPARHEASRRTGASFLAKLVAEHRITEDRVHGIIVGVADAAPRRAFKL